MHELNTYFHRSEEVQVPDAKFVSVVVDGQDEPQVMPISEAAVRAEADRKFRRKVRLPEAMEFQLNNILGQSLRQVRDHIYDRLSEIRPDLPIGIVSKHIEKLSLRLQKVFLEATKNAFMHGHFGDPTLPIRIDTSIIGTPNTCDDTIVLAVVDCGRGIDPTTVLEPEQAIKEAELNGTDGGFGQSIISGFMDDMQPIHLDDTAIPFRFMVRVSRELLRELLVEKTEIPTPSVP